MAAYVLEIVDRSGKTYMVPVNRFPFMIGRAKESDLALANASISRRHATIERRGGDLLVVDQESRNHVFVNGQRVSKKTVRAGDCLRLGSVEMVLCRPPNLRVRPASGELEPHYYPHDDGWNPAQTCSVATDAPSPAEEEAREASDRRPPDGSAASTRRFDWRKALQESLKSSTAHVHENVLDALEASTSFDRCFVLLFDESSPGDLQLLASRHTSRHDPRRAAATPEDICISREILRRVARSREVVVVSERDSQFNVRDSFVSSGARSAVCFPLVMKGRVGGVLYLDRLEDARSFSEAEVEQIGPLAGILALKLENLALLRDVRAGSPRAEAGPEPQDGVGGPASS